MMIYFIHHLLLSNQGYYTIKAQVRGVPFYLVRLGKLSWFFYD